MMSHVAGRLFRTLTAPLLHSFFPALCESCRKLLDPHTSHLCKTCSQNLLDTFAHRRPCPICGINLDLRSCTCDITPDHPAEKIWSFVDYDETARRLIHALKYRDRPGLAFHLGGLMGAHLPERILDGIDWVTPVPIHAKRRRIRGYNQAEFLARGLIGAIDQPVRYCDLLARTKFTKTQTALDRATRLANQRETFAVDPAMSSVIEGASILLVDDVITTGATTDTCTEVLLAAGARRVVVISLARD